MAVKKLSDYDDFYISDLVPTGGETGNAIYAGNGNDVVAGNDYSDIIYGENGSDRLYGMGNNDILLGGSGNDELYGGTGNDLLVGGANNDLLYGEGGIDDLWGGTGNDLYIASVTDYGMDRINDDKSATGQTGYGGGFDYVQFIDLSFSTGIAWAQQGDDLLLGNSTLTNGVIIEDFFQGGNNVVEVLVDSNGVQTDLTWLLA